MTAQLVKDAVVLAATVPDTSRRRRRDTDSSVINALDPILFNKNFVPKVSLIVGKKIAVWANSLPCKAALGYLSWANEVNQTCYTCSLVCNLLDKRRNKM